MKAVFFHECEYFLRRKIFSFHTQNFITVLQIEIDPAAGKMLQKPVNNVIGIACMFNIGFKYFNHVQLVLGSNRSQLFKNYFHLADVSCGVRVCKADPFPTGKFSHLRERKIGKCSIQILCVN